MSDQCEHGINYDAECATCEREIAEAKAAGALTPFEIGLYWKGAEAASAQVSEFQDNALEMARRADLAERRAEDAEFHVEQLRDALDSAERIGERAAELATERDAALARIARAERLIDSWELDAPDHSNPVFIGRLRECLRRDPALRLPVAPEREPLSCNAEGIPHSPHDWDFGSGETFRCAGTPGCDDECTGLCGGDA